jgi:transposase-like protein
VAGRKEEAYWDEAERLFVRENKTVEQIAQILPVSANTLYKWRLKGGWEAKRAAALASPRDLAERMRRTLELYLTTIEAKAREGTLDNNTFDSINKAMAAIKGVERQALDLRVMAVEVMKEFTDFLKAENLPPGELQLFGGRIRSWFRSLE